ncbi:DUF6090 family protein [Winogradskyella maritima]|uniref:DUF6090 family protein n=1 Tax=Winogradskyella maritima TaxID=1517766 RepID=A0ABV8AHM7_9FLAO|nr:DUF6090 family protein [Winogradskyella maritima]
MIKFFRQIRYNLMEKNKTSRYLKYAIGEIILVVIGILIALQINNWNEKSKQDSEAQRMLKDLRKDVINDTIQLRDIYDKTIKRDSNLIAIIDLVAPESGHDKQKFINLCIRNISFDNVFEVNSGTFDEAVSVGSLKYVPNDSLRQAIFNYYRTTKQPLNDKLNIEQSNKALPIFFEKFMTTKDIMNLFGSESRLPELDIGALGKDPEFMRLITLKLASQSEQRKSWNNYLSLGKELLDAIEKEINDD